MSHDVSLNLAPSFGLETRPPVLCLCIRQLLFVCPTGWRIKAAKAQLVRTGETQAALPL